MLGFLNTAGNYELQRLQIPSPRRDFPASPGEVVLMLGWQGGVSQLRLGLTHHRPQQKPTWRLSEDHLTLSCFLHL